MEMILMQAFYLYIKYIEQKRKTHDRKRKQLESYVQTMNLMDSMKEALLSNK